MKACLVVIVVAACADPGFRCPDLTLAPAGSTCGTRSITIDGDLADWDAIPRNSTVCTTCTTGQVAQLRVVRTADQLAILVETVDAPTVTTGHAYYVLLYGLRLPAYTLNIQVQPGTVSLMDINGTFITGLPSSFAFGSTAIEVGIALPVLPFDGGVIVGAQRDAFVGMWVADQDLLPFSTVCWEPGSPACAAP